MTSTSVALIASVLRQPRVGDDLQWVRYDAPFRTAQDYAAAEYLYRLRLCSLRLRSSLLSPSLPRTGPVSEVAHLLPHYPVQITAQLVYMDEPLSPVVESAAVYASAAALLPPASPVGGDTDTHAEMEVVYTFTDEWLVFPLELCDVPLDASCKLHLWHRDTHVAEAAFHVYSVAGELCVGQRQLALSTGGDAPSDEQLWSTSTRAAELLADFHRGMMPPIPWLDTLSIQQLEAEHARHGNAVVRKGSPQSAKDPCGAPTAILTLYLPAATTAVFFEPGVARVSDDMKSLLQHSDAADDSCDFTQRPFPDQYTFFKEHNLCEAKAAITSKTQYFLSDSSAPPGPKERHQLASLLRRPPIQLDNVAGAVVTGAGAGGVGGGRLEETRLLWKYRHFICRDGKYFLPFMRCVDWANTHSSERRAACALIYQWARPAFEDVLACLSFYFDHVAPVRQYAVRLLRREGDGRLCQLAFQLVQAVRYDSAEAELANFLVERAVGCWELCSTLYTLLSVEVALEKRRTLSAAGKASDDRHGGRALFEPLLRRLSERLTQQCPHFATRLRQQHAMHRVLQLLSRQLQQSSLDRLGKTALGNKLIAKQACGLRALFSSVHHGMPSRRNVNGSFSSSLMTHSSAGMREEHSMSSARTGDGSEEADANGGDGSSAVEASDVDSAADDEVRRLRFPPLSPQSQGSAPRSPPSQSGAKQQYRSRHASAVDVLDRYGVATLATHPGIPITGLLSDSLYIFKSAKLPMRLTFTALRPAGLAWGGGRGGEPLYGASPSPCLLTPLAMQPAPSQQRSGGLQGMNSSGGGASAAVAAEEQAEGFLGAGEGDTVPLAMMYKYNDDIRQDQLIVQLIRLMDDLLQRDGLQLYLTPYRVIATAPNEGLVEIVPQVTTFFSVQRDVLKYLRVYNSTAELLRQAMDRYTRSFAGYCVITFVLGIGDRHLENILITQDGRLLHIDFGYVLGNDPKPFPPPMKINREMVEVLGGPQSTGFTEFKLYCCSAYNTLRKHAPLLLHILLLGAHTEGMPQVTGEGGDPRVNLLKVQEKLRLDLTNAQATQYLQNVIADSVGSIFTNLWDVLHAAAQATRG
ncbi:PI3K / phosphatidylinositol 3-kinase [Leishmania donovani]|uniref:phosphatidylinositol 3-kinase n=1 Tax=Leishmania donovani TaxID=5661 RepID=A0A3Q8IGA3_LEIDO|nr:phosphatidylinositol 3-kinase, putative [Leishmania donovani]AYU79292.1 phosphatidylinositol 3-kinase, putative [Leishmania donovani]TPP52330.1 Phosphatidylinositol 3- and 4-kinase family protein [Leishmania donovani]CAJ1989283.1 PI3K / phosphatidylinositol 3-kinase [Leishmania donovani]CBZ34597.1 phosphatidylinositol 3-kinase, putative [Leishmania donovani]VDZ45154.1 phosphatidylinositol_3-kinase_putative/GeneDB:LmjF.24.2010 [Leishmania donovani]